MALRLTVISALVGLLPTAAAAEPIHDAAARGDVDAVKRLLAEGTSVDQFETTAPYGRKTTALYRATMAGRSEVVELLLDAGASPTLRSSDTDLHALQVAAKFGRADILQMFLDRGADPNTPGKTSTALHVALKSEKHEIVRQLLDAGALPRIEQPSIASRISEGDPDRGEQVFVQHCRVCHLQPRPNDRSSSKDRIASLWNVVGRDIASLQGTIYSDAMRAIDGVWTYDRLNSLIALPGGFVPGTLMEPLDYTPPSEEDRISLIAYLRRMSDDPVSLPD